METEGWPEGADIASVEVAQNGGPFTPVSQNITDGELPSLADPSHDWALAMVNLSDFVDSQIQFRFRFRTIDWFENGYAGFYVDDVTITQGQGPCDPPSVPSEPNPANEAIGVVPNIILTWTQQTSGSCLTTHDVYFGVSSESLELIYSGLELPRCDPSAGYSDTINCATTYYWQVISTNCCDITSGPVWSFTTKAITGDLDNDCSVDMIDLRVFTSHWGDSGCNDPNWCGDCDLDHNSQVDMTDFATIAANWLIGD